MPISRAEFDAVENGTRNTIDWKAVIEELKGHAWTAKQVADVAAKHSAAGHADITRASQKLRTLAEQGVCGSKYGRDPNVANARSMHYYYFP